MYVLISLRFLFSYTILDFYVYIYIYITSPRYTTALECSNLTCVLFNCRKLCLVYDLVWNTIRVLEFTEVQRSHAIFIYLNYLSSLRKAHALKFALLADPLEIRQIATAAFITVSSSFSHF